MQTMQKWLLRLCLVALLMPGVAAAQTVIGSGCVSLDAGVGDQSITVTRPVAANTWIVISAASDNVQAHFAADPVSDSAGNAYPIYDVTLMAGSAGVLATFAGRSATALNAGNQIAVHYTDNGLFAMQSCAVAAAFPVVLPLPDASDGYGESRGAGNLLAVTIGLPTQYASDLVYSAFASAGTPGATVALAPAQGLGQVCTSDATLCLLPAWNLGAAAAGIQEGADAQSDNSVNWGALLIAFQSDDRIFANGFE
jgi:hypothetical protein